MNIIFVTKADGTQERFEKKKIIRTCLRSGTNKETAEYIAEEIRKKVRNGTTTHDIYRMILSFLAKTEKISSFLFRLREALAGLDSVSFELYVKKLLESYGYKCKWNCIIKGKSVEHQVDIIAEKDYLFLIECKHHFNQHRFCGLGNVLQLQARMEDINDGYEIRKNKYNFNYSWIVTNTKFSEHAKKYARAKDIRLTGWGSREFEIQKLAQRNKVFPITLLKANRNLIKNLLRAEIITLQDLLRSDKTRKATNPREYRTLVKQASSLIQ